MIARNNVFPEISISPQLILDCDYSDNYGCSGGDALGVYRFFHEHGGAIEDSCNPYVAESWYQGHTRECNDFSYCSFTTSVNDANSEQYSYSQYPKFKIDEYSFTTKGEEAMMKLLQDGPLACAMAVNDDFYQNYDGGIYHDTTNYKSIDHEIVILGYGTDESTGTPYWIGMNSWGTALSFIHCFAHRNTHTHTHVHMC